MTVLREDSEAQRLASVRRLGLIDAATEPEFADLVELAAAICAVPISLLSIIDETRQWFLAAVGLPGREHPRSETFCQYTIQQDDMLIVEDTLQHDLFATHPAVVNEPGVRFYAGISVRSADGQPVGTLCVADVVPRQISKMQVNALRVLAKQANARLELLEQRRVLEVALAEAELVKAKLAASEARFVTFMDSAPFMSYLKDAEGRFLFYNQAIAERYKISREEWLGKTMTEMFPIERAELLHRHDMEVLAANELHVMDETVEREGGDDLHLRMYRFPCADDDKLLLGVISVDVTEEVRQQAELHRYQGELEALNAKLSELAATDPLTGLANRRVFDERLAMEFAQARRMERALSVMMIDVDDFKQLNDQHGHDVGDECLMQLAGLVKGLLRESDLVARYGGEEFVILLPDTDATQAAHLGERLLAATRAAVWKCTPMKISGGIAGLQEQTEGPRQMLSLADAGLYAAKRAGKDRMVCMTCG